jgi:putative transposase
MERWIRTLKEECIYLHDFADLEEARRVIGAFVERFNRAWLLERHGYQTPAAVRTSTLARAA